MIRDSLPTCYGIIPARYGSSRFPGKPLADIQGNPMFWHVYHRAMQCPELTDVIIATDDDRIADKARSLAVPVVMTRSDHASGTDRVWEAASLLNASDADVIVNIQGDEPLLDPAMLSTLIAPFANPDVSVTTLAHRMDQQDSGNPDRVKVVFTPGGLALYFSRAPIPFAREGAHAEYFCHIGLYAFRRAALDQFVSLGPGRLEQIEKLEQLRLLENHIPIHVAVTQRRSISVDRPEDIERVLDILNASAND